MTARDKRYEEMSAEEMAVIDAEMHVHDILVLAEQIYVKAHADPERYKPLAVDMAAAAANLYTVARMLKPIDRKVAG